MEDKPEANPTELQIHSFPKRRHRDYKKGRRKKREGETRGEEKRRRLERAGEGEKAELPPILKTQLML